MILTEVCLYAVDYFKGLKKKYGSGKERWGKNILIAGFGRIGQEVAKIGLGVGMKVIACDNHQKETTIKSLMVIKKSCFY